MATVNVTVEMSPEMLRDIDEAVDAHSDINSRSQ